MSRLISTVSDLAPLVSGWMFTTMMVCALLTGVALLLHRLARGVAPSRIVWSLTLGTAVALTLSQPWRREARVDTRPVSMTITTPTSVAPSETPSLGDRTSVWIRGAADRTSAGLQAVARSVAQQTARAPMPFKLSLVAIWPLATLSLFAIGVWSYRRQRRLLRAAKRLELDGHTVFVSDTAGPAVYGVRHPRIVVPSWLLERTPDEQRLVLTHEQAHIAAGDPMLLLSACVAAALVPWNPLVWYMLNRLRLSIELDCDARVLEAGATARHYGALLIDLSAAATTAPLLTGATAFSHHASHLERRLRRMTDRPATHITARRFGSLTIGALALLAACGTELPTSAELEGMDVAAAQQKTLAVAPGMSPARFLIDGKEVSEAEAKALSADRIASIEIRKLDKKKAELFIATRDKNASGTTTDSLSVKPLARKAVLFAARPDGTVDTSRMVVIGDSMSPTSVKRPDVLILVDGVKSSEAEMKALSPDRIERIEVVKGAAAEKLYGPDAAKGAIVVTTKK